MWWIKWIQHVGDLPWTLDTGGGYEWSSMLRWRHEEIVCSKGLIEDAENHPKKWQSGEGRLGWSSMTSVIWDSRDGDGIFLGGKVRQRTYDWLRKSVSVCDWAKRRMKWWSFKDAAFCLWLTRQIFVSFKLLLLLLLETRWLERLWVNLNSTLSSFWYRHPFMQASYNQWLTIVHQTILIHIFFQQFISPLLIQMFIQTTNASNLTYLVFLANSDKPLLVWIMTEYTVLPTRDSVQFLISVVTVVQEV